MVSSLEVVTLLVGCLNSAGDRISAVAEPPKPTEGDRHVSVGPAPGPSAGPVRRIGRGHRAPRRGVLQLGAL